MLELPKRDAEVAANIPKLRKVTQQQTAYHNQSTSKSSASVIYSWIFYPLPYLDVTFRFSR